MTGNDTPQIGILGNNNNVYLNWLDTDTGERGQGWFDLTRLCELGYGDRHIGEGLVVRVQTVKLGSVPV